jgi:hypothetical protein
MDLRVGGAYPGARRDSSGRVMWAKFLYREVNPPCSLRDLVQAHGNGSCL